MYTQKKTGPLGEALSAGKQNIQLVFGISEMADNVDPTTMMRERMTMKRLCRVEARRRRIDEKEEGFLVTGFEERNVL